MTYYHFDTNTSFSWDGNSNTVQVHKGGYGEPVSDTFEINEMRFGLRCDYSFSAHEYLDWFKKSCDAYVEMKEKQKQPTESWS